MLFQSSRTPQDFNYKSVVLKISLHSLRNKSVVKCGHPIFRLTQRLIQCLDALSQFGHLSASYRIMRRVLFPSPLVGLVDRSQGFHHLNCVKII